MSLVGAELDNALNKRVWLFDREVDTTLIMKVIR
jgi:hypothetical protein